jgi:hypothetical protein
MTDFVALQTHMLRRTYADAAYCGCFLPTSQAGFAR